MLDPRVVLVSRRVLPASLFERGMRRYFRLDAEK